MKFTSLVNSHINDFKQLISSEAIKLLTPKSPENNDQNGIHTGNSKLCLRPSSVTEISNILSYCNKENIAICI